MFSCSNEANPVASGLVDKLNKNKQSADSIEEKIELDKPVEADEVEFTQASNGLEFGVVQYYVDLHHKGELTSIVKGAAQKIDHKKNKVYLDNKLYAQDGMDFFYGNIQNF